MSKRLWLMRHGAAAFHKGKDFDRPLHNSASGQFEQIQRALNTVSFFPKKVLVSPALRTLQTFEWWNNALGNRLNKFVIEDLYLATSSQIEQVLWTALSKSDDQDIMLIGHNPGISDFIDKSLESDSINFMGLPTAGLAVLEYSELQSWDELLFRQAKILKLFYP